MRTRMAHSISTLCLLATVAVAGACGRKASGGTGALAVTDIDLGPSLNADLTIADKTTTFHPNDVIYASVATQGTGKPTLKARWTFQDNHQGSTTSPTVAS